MFPFKNYYLEKYGNKNLNTTYFLDLEPWSAPENLWSAALKGKSPCYIYLFDKTIERQYKRRKEIFLGTDILPEFELKTLRVV